MKGVKNAKMSQTNLNMKEVSKQLADAENHLSQALDLQPLDLENHIIQAWDIISVVREAIDLDNDSHE